MQEHLEQLLCIANTNRLHVHDGYTANERRIVQTVPRADWDYSGGLLSGSGLFMTPNELKTIFPDGTLERAAKVVLKKDQAFQTFANPQEKEGEKEIEDPYKYTSNDGTVCVLQAWTLSFDPQFKTRCVGGIEPTNALDNAALTAVFEANEHFRGGYTVDSCVRITMERAQQLQEVAAHVRQKPTTALEAPCLCAFQTQVAGHVYIGGVAGMINFLKNPAVQKALDIKEFDEKKGKVVVKTFEKGTEKGTQSFQFSVEGTQSLVVYRREGKKEFWCVKLLRQFNEEATEGAMLRVPVEEVEEA